MEKPPELLKPFANRLAQLAVSNDGAQAIRMLRQAAFLSPASLSEGMQSQAPDAKPETKNGDGVGIWERKQENGQTYFARRKEMAKEWPFWANVGKIEPKKAKRRVVLIGESVARGFLYDPQFTPAMALEKILRTQLGKDAIEVVDLARTNLSFEVRELAFSALLLEPDMVIMFCGNNWDPGAPAPAEISSVDSILRQEGIPGLKRFGEAQLARRASQVVHDIAGLYKSRGIPMVWIVPEFNLGDWRDPITNAPCLPEGMNHEWMILRERGEQAFQQGDLAAASEHASKMLELDHGTCVTPLYILAECSRRCGDLKAAKRYFELARDAVIWDTSKNIAPRSYSITQEILRQEIPKYGNLVVDLPQLFEEHLKGEIADRRLFVDYCHLSSEGIQIAMAAAASGALQVFTGKNIFWMQLMSVDVLPSPQIEAEASFLAAVHNAHWWQPHELVKHYCSLAVKLSPHVSKLMTSFIDLQTRSAPMLMCRSAEEIAGLGSPLMQNYLLRFNYQRLDSLLLEAVVNALKQAGIDAGKQLDKLRKQEHSVSRGPVDLLQFYYCSEGSQQQEIMWIFPHLNDYLNHKMHHYYKAFWRESRFVFVAEANNPVHLRLACRLPNLELTAGVMSLLVNGECVGKTLITRDWETWDFTAAGDLVKDGLNEVVVRWPMPIFPGLKPLETVVSDLMERIYPEFFCVFGEIHSLVASDARKTSAVEFREELSAVEVP
ncbi:MAG: hypothetical protein DMG65_21860 [Candidatus Angelobacter sp. Gp1-AA117]|nr:MAG: hypothetical protein DMG65_21860 [Candidatus Angelobacter sp. Gp1-AA117]